ncbi:MAG: BT4734/BF3469 family protein [Bacteroidota bacterium]
MHTYLATQGRVRAHGSPLSHIFLSYWAPGQIRRRQLPTARRSLGEILHAIQIGETASLCAAVRAQSYGSPIYKAAKQKLPFFSPGGGFAERSQESLEAYSQLLCFDIDQKDNPVVDMAVLKSQLQEEAALLAIWRSAGGQGLSLLIWTTATAEQHSLVWDHWAAQLEARHQCKIDRASRKLAQVLYLSHDPELYLCLEPQQWEVPASVLANAKPATPKSSYLPHERNETTLLLDSILEQLKAQEIGLTSEYERWIKLGYLLLNELPLADAEAYFHLFSQADGEIYDAEEAHQTFAGVQRSWESRGEAASQAGLGSLIHWALEAGLELPARMRVYQSYKAQEIAAYLPGKYHNARNLQSRLLLAIEQYQRYEDNSHREGQYVRLDQAAIAEPLNCSQQTVSRNLIILREAGFLMVRIGRARQGRKAPLFYALTETYWELRALYHPTEEPEETPLPKLSDKEAKGNKEEMVGEIVLPEEAASEAPSLENKTAKREEKEAVSQDVPNPLDPQFLVSDSTHDQLADIALAWQAFVDRVGEKRPDWRPQRRTKELFALLIGQDPALLGPILARIPGIRAAKSVYYWLADRCYLRSGERARQGQLLNPKLKPSTLQEWEKRRGDRFIAERLRLIQRPGVDFAVVSLQGQRKCPRALPDGVVYVLRIDGPLWVKTESGVQLYAP